MVDVEWCVLAVFYCFETNTPLLSSCNLLIQLKQGQLASLFSIPFFLYSRNILEYSFFTARELCAFLLSSAVTQGSWVLPATSAPHPAVFWAGADKKNPNSWRKKVTAVLSEEAGLPAARGQSERSHFYLCESFWSQPVTQRLTRWSLTCGYRGRAIPRAVRDHSRCAAENRSDAAALGEIEISEERSWCSAKRARPLQQSQRCAPPEDRSGSRRVSLKRRKGHLKCHMIRLGQQRF